MNIRNELAFNRILSHDFEFIRNIEVLLEVNFPLVFSFDANENKKYLAYVVDFKRRKKILNIMFVETSNETLYDLLDQNISLRTALTKNRPYIVYSDGKEIYDDINELLPKDNFLLTELIPNSIDIVSKKQRIKYELNWGQNYYDEFIKFKEVRNKYNVLSTIFFSKYTESLNTIVDQYTTNYKNKHVFSSHRRNENKPLKEQDMLDHVKLLKKIINDNYVFTYDIERN
ncbi:hypothetical protein [Cohnella sp. GbtcB17]|uniref:hypothetical protein n=1 Tax=Cohnella sp. GbtcB17 TaxID=2824762 RepID=UPI001C304A32|nr:hypothetical protein [Cohnella sp. GbtcB17]